MTDHQPSPETPAHVIRQDRANGRPSQTGRIFGSVILADGVVGHGWLTDDWLVAVRTVQDEDTGARKVVELVLLAAEEDAGPSLTTDDLRAVSLRSYIDDAREHSTEVAGFITRETDAALAALRETWSVSARGRTSGRPELDYAILAAAYARRVEQGDRRPVAFLAEVIGQSAVTVTQRVREARRMDLLTPVKPGRAGGRLTPKALALLQDLVAVAHEQRED